MADPIEQWLEESISLPGKLQRALRLMAELDADCINLEVQVRAKEKACVDRLKRLRESDSGVLPEGLQAEFVVIKSMQLKVQALMREKLAVNRQISSFIHHEQQRLLVERDKLLHTVHGGTAQCGQIGSDVGSVRPANPDGSAVSRSLLRKKAPDRLSGLVCSSEVAKSAVTSDRGQVTASSALMWSQNTHPGPPDAGNVEVVSGGGNPGPYGLGGDDRTDRQEHPPSGSVNKAARPKAYKSSGTSAEHGGTASSKGGSDVSVQSNAPTRRVRKGLEVASSRQSSGQTSTAASSTSSTPSDHLKDGSTGLNVFPAVNALTPVELRTSGGAFTNIYTKGNAPGVSKRHLTPANSQRDQPPLKSRGGISMGVDETSHSLYDRNQSGASPSCIHVHARNEVDTPAAVASLGTGLSAGSRGSISAQSPTPTPQANRVRSIPSKSGAYVSSTNVQPSSAEEDTFDPWEGTCPVCHKGETSTEFINMVACDSCNQWFHFECVGYSAQTRDEEAWFCPHCYQRGLVP